ncbi:MAG: hypothetical protein AB7O31_05085 [Burkholderiales bacterium]
MIKRILFAILAAAHVAAVHAQSPKPLPEDAQQTKIVQEIFDCVQVGLDPAWKLAWVNVLEVSRSEDGKSRNFEANMRYTIKDDDTDGEPLQTCDNLKIVKLVGDLNEFLKPEERKWSIAQFVFHSDGQFTVQYEYAPESPAPTPAAGAKPGAKPTTKPAATQGLAPATKPGAKPGAGFKLRTQ